jgi:hypothetical protein
MLLGNSYEECCEELIQAQLNDGPGISKTQDVIPDCPYRGLFAFREQDREYFFGREDFIINKLLPQAQRKPFVAVIGSSGSGKSSVVCRVRRRASPHPPPLRTGLDCYQSSGSSLGLPERFFAM